MLSKKPHLMIRKLSELLVPGKRSPVSPENSPRSPLDMRFSSPGSSKRYQSDRIGLGVVFALDKSSNGINRHEILAKTPVYCSGSDSKSFEPVRFTGKLGVSEIDLSEECTYVTFRDGPTKCYITGSYYEDGFELCDGDGNGFVPRCRKPAEESPAKKSEDFGDFLSSCCLCKKKLHGKDIYIYKGEKGFCSDECRSVYMVKEERTQVSRSVDASGSPNTGGHIFTTGIFVF